MSLLRGSIAVLRPQTVNADSEVCSREARPWFITYSLDTNQVFPCPCPDQTSLPRQINGDRWSGKPSRAAKAEFFHTPKVAKKTKCDGLSACLSVCRRSAALLLWCGVLRAWCRETSMTDGGRRRTGRGWRRSAFERSTPERWGREGRS